MADASDTETPPGLQRGERAPDLVLPTRAGTPTHYYAHAGGRPALLVHARDDAVQAVRDLAAVVGDERERLTVHVIGPQALADAMDDPGDPDVLVDRNGRAAAAYRTDGTTVAFLLDASLRVLHSWPLAEGTAEEVAVAVRHRLDAMEAAAAPPRVVSRQAPVLIVPDVLSPQECTDLVALWHTDHTETGVETSEGSTRGERLEAKLKRRADHVVTDPDRLQALATSIGRRLFVEVARCFNYRPKRFEGFKIGRYTAEDRGFFSLHRDNLSPTTAHRRFALTLNLTGDYEGGELRFPEFGPDLYRPPPGAALVFSGSLLHEVADVTAGERFVLLSFLFGDETVRQPG